MSLDAPVPPPPDPRALLREAGLGAKKSWGQNFLCDQRVLAGIAAASVREAAHPVVELGAGLGALTYHLVQRHPRVVAIERDREIAPILRRELAWAESLEVREADAARLDYAELARELGGELVVAGNLPYQIASRIMVSLADEAESVIGATLLVQREVAERLVAGPGTKRYGLLSVLIQRAFAAKILRHVPPGAFLPPPKVTSSVVALERREPRPTPHELRLIAEAARAGFSSRRKTLRNAVSGATGASGSAIEAVLESAGLDAGARAETLTVEEFLRLGEALDAAGLVEAVRA